MPKTDRFFCEDPEEPFRLLTDKGVGYCLILLFLIALVLT